MTARRNASLTFIFITILVDAIGVGIIFPVMPSLLKELTGEGISHAAGVGGLLTLAYAGMQFIFSPFLGELSDRFGRRPILLISLFFLSFDYVLHALAPSIALLFVGRILAGMGGASFTVAMAYIADISTPENKAKNFGLVGAAFGIGFMVGPAIGGLAGYYLDARAPFWIAAALVMANFLYGFFILPESLPKEKRRKMQLNNMIPGLSLLELRKYKSLLWLIAALFFSMLAGQVMPAVWSFFTMREFSWNETEVGISLAAVGLLVGVVQGVLISRTVKRFGERKTILIGFFLSMVGMVLYAFATNEWLLYAFMLPYILGGVAGPTVQGVLSNQVSDLEQGALQGVLTSLTGLAALIGMPAFAFIFSYFTSEGAPVDFAGSPFAVAAVLFVLAFVFVIIALRKIDVDTHQNPPTGDAVNPPEDPQPEEPAKVEPSV